RAQPLGNYRERVGQAPEGSDREPFHAGVPEPSRAQVAKPHHPEPPVGHPTDPSETKPAKKMSTGGSVGFYGVTATRAHPQPQAAPLLNRTDQNWCIQLGMLPRRQRHVPCSP